MLRLCPHGDSNPGLSLERATSWASRRWGRFLPSAKTAKEFSRCARKLQAIFWLSTRNRKDFHCARKLQAIFWLSTRNRKDFHCARKLQAVFWPSAARARGLYQHGNQGSSKWRRSSISDELTTFPIFLQSTEAMAAKLRSSIAGLQSIDRNPNFWLMIDRNCHRRLPDSSVMSTRTLERIVLCP